MKLITLFLAVLTTSIGCAPNASAAADEIYTITYRLDHRVDQCYAFIDNGFAEDRYLGFTWVPRDVCTKMLIPPHRVPASPSNDNQ